jgi:hypothetical protein
MSLTISINIERVDLTLHRKDFLSIYSLAVDRTELGLTQLAQSVKEDAILT